MKRHHPAKPASVYRVDSNAWWRMVVAQFVRAMRHGGRWASNEPASGGEPAEPAEGAN